MLCCLSLFCSLLIYGKLYLLELFLGQRMHPFPPHGCITVHLTQSSADGCCSQWQTPLQWPIWYRPHFVSVQVELWYDSHVDESRRSTQAQFRKEFCIYHASSHWGQWVDKGLEVLMELWRDVYKTLLRGKRCSWNGDQHGLITVKNKKSIKVSKGEKISGRISKSCVRVCVSTAKWMIFLIFVRVHLVSFL